MKKILLLIVTVMVIVASCSKKINNPVYVKKEAYTQKIIYNTEETKTEFKKALAEMFPKGVSSYYTIDIPVFKGKKGLRARIKVGAAPLIDSCCTFGAVGEVRDTVSVHQEYTQIKTLFEGETFEWIMLLEFPPNGLPPIIIAVAYVHGGNWLTDPLVFDYVPDLGVGQYTLRLTGDVLPTYRPIGSNDIVVQLN